jgi:hypothetical protein
MKHNPGLAVCPLLWAMHTNVYWTTAKLTTFIFVLFACLQRDQHAETTVHALIDCQPVGPCWANRLTNLYQAKRSNLWH